MDGAQSAFDPICVFTAFERDSLFAMDEKNRPKEIRSSLIPSICSVSVCEVHEPISSTFFFPSTILAQ